MTFDELLTMIGDVTGLVVHGDGGTAIAASGLDSLGLVQLLLHGEDHGVPLPDELVEAWSTLGDIHAQFERWFVADPQPAGREGKRLDGDPVSVLGREPRHVVLAPVLDAHIPLLHARATQPERAMRWWARGRTLSRSELAERIWRDSVLAELVVDRRSDEVLGLVQVHDYEQRDGHAQVSVLGLGASSPWLMEGAVAVVARAFAMWPLHKVYAFVPSFNEQHIAPRIGFELEGRLRDHEHLLGERRDLLVYAAYREAVEMAAAGIWS